MTAGTADGRRPPRRSQTVPGLVAAGRRRRCPRPARARAAAPAGREGVPDRPHFRPTAPGGHPQEYETRSTPRFDDDGLGKPVAAAYLRPSTARVYGRRGSDVPSKELPP
ncbi:hypothetical protein GCM10010129_26190 [Streptomyces fumigatiscleroticus]|nr:hypothetical protein GCM10010129_26190 [Streptomyces fumigatiscleroticus]